MRVNLPPKVRFAIYVINGFGSIVVAYLVSKDLIGDAETAAWTAFSAFTSAMAGFNVSNPNKVNDLKG